MTRKIFLFFTFAFVLVCLGIGWLFFAFRRAERETVELSGVEPALVYAVIKAESGFSEKAESRAGAVGLMQLLPSTAQFIAEKNHVEYSPERLKESGYNVRLGCMYLGYLLERFGEETALAAYNAGEGTVLKWLKDPRFSPDGERLSEIPYPETARYVKKVIKFRKIYRFLYD